MNVCMFVCMYVCMCVYIGPSKRMIIALEVCMLARLFHSSHVTSMGERSWSAQHREWGPT